MLLPSNELMDLHQTVPICLSDQELPANCDIRYGQFYYFFMFNEAGELTNVANISDGLSSRKKEGMSLPEAFLAMVDESLQIDTSLESCERDYLDSKGSKESYKQLKKKLNQLERIGSMRVVALLREQADQMTDPTLTRFRALALETAAVKQQVINKRAIDRLAKNMEQFLAENPGHPEVQQILKDYFKIALKYTYDVHGHCQRLAATWRTKTDDPKSAALSKLGNQLIKTSDQHLASIDKAIGKLKQPNGWEAPRLFAQRGDSQKTLESLAGAMAVPVMKPIYQDWKKQANADLK